MAGYAFYGNEHVIGCLGERLASAGLSRVEEAADAAFVLSYCTTMTELEDLYFGEDGLLSTLAEGTVVVDMSPVTPNFANEMNAVTTISGYKMVTAPLIVKDRVAAHALDRDNLRCACFGEDGSQEDAAAMLDAIFSEVETVGSAGAAQLIRSAATIQESARIVSAVEALALFKSARSSMSIASCRRWRARSICSSCWPSSAARRRALRRCPWSMDPTAKGMPTDWTGPRRTPSMQSRVAWMKMRRTRIRRHTRMRTNTSMSSSAHPLDSPPIEHGMRSVPPSMRGGQVCGCSGGMRRC